MGIAGLTSWLAVTLLKGTWVLATALLLVAFLRRAPGRARHRLWSLAFAGLLVLPALALTLPPLPLPLPALPLPAVAVAGLPETGTALVQEDGGNAAGVADGAPEVAAGSPQVADRDELLAGPGGSGMAGPALRSGLPAGLLALWLAGFAIAVALLVAGLLRCRALVRRAVRLDDRAWQRDLEWHRNFFGIRRRVRLLASPQVRTPMTGGILRPVVLVPEGAAGWSAERRRLVLLHELVHIRRHDVTRHMLARLGVSLYWFHPLAWLAGRSAAVAREQACDEEVIRLGVRPSVYASHLLALAETLTPGRIPAAALPMTQRSQLEKRLMTILDTNARPRAAWTSALAAAAMVLTAVSAGMAAPAAQQAPAARGGSAAPAAVSAPSSGAPAAAQSTACWPEGSERIRGSFSGTISTNDRTGTRVINAVGVRDGDRIIQHWVDEELRLCMLVHGDVQLQDEGARIGRIGDGGAVVLEAELRGRLQRLVIRNDGGGARSTWTVNGAERQVDAGVERWRDQMTTALADYARIANLRGQRSSLRGEISSIRGQRSSLRGEISSIRGQRSSLQGQISSIRGQRSSLNGEISSARGHVSSLRGQISSAKGHVSSLRGQISSARGHVSSMHGQSASHRGAISGLQASRYGANEEELAVITAAIRRHEEAIDEIERQIADYDVEARVAAIEQQIEDYDLDARVAAIERQIEEYDLDGRVAEVESHIQDVDVEAQVAEIERQIGALDVEGKVGEIERQIEALNVEGKVQQIEREIEALNVDARVQQLEEHLEPALRELRRTIELIGG